MPTKDPIKKAEANRERQRRFRAKKVAEESKAESKPVTPHVTQGVTSVSQAEIDQLPLSLKYMVDNETRRRAILKMPSELKERLEMAVRRFRGY
jgi:hypothetical protein